MIRFNIKDFKNIVIWYSNIWDIIIIIFKKKNFETIDIKIEKDKMYSYAEAAVESFFKIKKNLNIYKIIRNISIFYITIKFISIITIIQACLFFFFSVIRWLGINIKGNKANKNKMYIVFLYNTNMSSYLLYKNKKKIVEKKIMIKILKKLVINALFIINWGYPKIVIKKALIAVKILINIIDNPNKTGLHKTIDVIFNETFLKDREKIMNASLY